MKTQDIIDTMTTKVKAILQNHGDQLDKPLTAENAEKVIEIIRQATTQAAAEGLKTYLEAGEYNENSVMHNGEKFQFNRHGNKEFQTTFGKIVLKHRFYQNKEGGSFVPLDHAWNMEHQFATVEVREAVLYALALMPAGEARPLFEKSSTFNIAESSFKKIAENISSDLESNIDKFLETLRRDEIVPVTETKVVAVSMDGANVLLQEPGKKKGRKRQRPGERKFETEGGFDSPTSYKNAVVGSVSLYGDVSVDEKTPQRLQSRYVARMPEEAA